MKRIAAITALILFALPATTQEYEAFFEEFDVILHQIQVNVLDRDGKPIRGLTKEDFEIKLDGQFQTIETVEEIDLEAVVAGADARGEAISEQARRLFVFLFDLQYSNKQGVLNGIKAANDFVQAQMLPTDLASVFTYTQLRGVSMVTNFTNDQDHLLRAINTLGLDDTKNLNRGPSGYYLDGLLQTTMDTMGLSAEGLQQGTGQTNRNSASGFAAEHLEEMLRLAQNTDRNNYYREVFNLLAGLEKFGDGLRFIRGRKNLIWFSSGFDARALVGASSEELRRNAELAMFGEHERVPFDQLGRGDIQSFSTRVVESLQGSGTVVFAVDTSGLDEAANSKSGLQTLNFFSVDTGGRVFTNQNRFDEPLGEIEDITNHYYLVSFYPDTKRQKEVARLRVTVNEPRAKVYTNRGLLLDPDFKNMTQIEKNIQISEYIARDQIVRGIPIGLSVTQSPMTGPLTKLSLGVELRGDYFLSPDIKAGERNIEIYAIAVQEETEQIFDQSYFNFRIDPRKLTTVLEKTGVKYFATLFVKRGDYKIKVVARDLENGKIGSYIARVKAEDYNNLTLTGPVTLSEENWVVIRKPESMEERFKSGDLDFSYPYQIGEKVFIPSSEPIVASDRQARFFYSLNYRRSASVKAEPQLQMLFMDEEQKLIQIPPQAITAQTELRDEQPFLTNVLVTIDMRQVKLETGKSYKLMAYFSFEDQLPPIKSMAEFTVAEL